VVSRNAVKHGILNTHFFLLEGEDTEQFQCLLEGLQAALRPIGMLEDMLVEKLAVNFWRHRRLIQAESARVERNRLDKAKHSIKFSPTPPDPAHIEWCQAVLKECAAIDSLELTEVEKRAPVVFEQSLTDAGPEDKDEGEGEDIMRYLKKEGGMIGYLIELKRYCRDKIKEAEVFPLIVGSE
jgi:hypothetical protein